MTLMEYLPEKYGQSRETAAIQRTLQPEVDALWKARNWLMDQLNPRTASGKGLKLWEDAMGIRPAEGDTLELRRGRIIAKIRGTGTVTAELLKAIVESFSVSAVEVTEYPRENRVAIRYSTAGLQPPPDPYQISDAILEVIPAHLSLGAITEAEPMIAALRLVAAGASGSETALPEWRKDYHFTQSIRIVGAFGSCSVTELPPAE